MKYEDDNPDYLERLGDLLPAEALKKLNELLEQLHQSNDNNHQGSNNTFVYVAPGAQYVKNQYVVAHPSPPKGREKRAEELPETLSTEKAMALWQKAQDAGYVDDNFQPLISRTQAALLADAMAFRLGIKEKWKTFEALWNRRNMYRDLQDALNQKQSLQFRDNLKDLFS